MTTSGFPLAYLITFHTYGSWLHGDAKGSVDREHSRYGGAFAPSDADRLVAMKSRMKAGATTLSVTNAG